VTGPGEGKALFRLRFLQLRRDPTFLLLGGGAILLTLLSTCLAPLPALEGGRVWADFLLSGLQACLLLFSLSLLLLPEGGLLARLPALPGNPFRGRLAWFFAEWGATILLVLPALALGWLLLPRPWGRNLLLPSLVLLFQGAFLVSLASFARTFLGRAAGTVFLLAFWILLSLPPLSWADPRGMAPGSLTGGGGSPIGAFLLWAGSAWFFLSLQAGGQKSAPRRGDA